MPRRENQLWDDTHWALLRLERAKVDIGKFGERVDAFLRESEGIEEALDTVEDTMLLEGINDALSTDELRCLVEARHSGDWK